MTHHSQYSQQSFFFHQKKRQSIQRVKKPLDILSIFGDKRETFLSFKPQREGLHDRVKSARSRRPLSSISRQSSIRLSSTEHQKGNEVVEVFDALKSDRRRRPSSAISKTSGLPPVDPSGPHFINQLIQEEAELEEDNPAAQTKYKFNEIKIASTGILSKISKRVEIPLTDIELSLPETLVRILEGTYHQLVADVIVDKREWQTDCYLDYKTNANKKSPEGTEKKKKDKMSGVAALERPLTGRSTASGVSIKSDVSHDSSHDAEYDKLPHELRMQVPQILRYRRESLAPKRKGTVPRTRLEKFKDMKTEADNIRIKKFKQKIATLDKIKFKDDTALMKNDEEDNQSIVITRASTINFSLSSKDCADQGWIVHPSHVRDPESYTLQQWASARFKETLRQREESQLTAKLRGEDGQLIVCYYSDKYTRSLRGSRHQRASSFPLPSILNKLPPNIATVFTPHSQHDALLSNETSALCRLQLPDGSGFCRYYSGQCAISMSRKGDGSRGLYTVIYDDSKFNNVIGYFMPDGRGACYHRNGALHMITDPTGGRLLDEDGYEIRKWEWPSAGEKMPQTVRIQLNSHIVIQCTGKCHTIVKFSCHGQLHQFSVGLTVESLSNDNSMESFWMKKSDVVSDTLQTSFHFNSRAAKVLLGQPVEEASLPPSKPHSRETTKDRKGKGILQMSLVVQQQQKSPEESDSYLQEYKGKMKSIVNEWLGYYCQMIGLSPQSGAHRINGGESSAVNLTASRHLLSSVGLKSRGSSRGSTRPSSRQMTYPGSRSSTPYSKPNSTVDALIVDSPLTSNIVRSELLHQHPFKVGTSKPQPQKSPARSFKSGCTIALHDTLVQKLSSIPKCKCDRRHIPLIRDLEYDTFIKNHVPHSQLILVYITDTSHTVNNSGELLLESIHYAAGANRYAPCQQSANDLFRILKYDLKHSCDDLNTLQPLLVNRHHVFPGMFMMYMGQHLLGGLTQFNGYGVTKKDLMKQIHKSIEAGKEGHFLPVDYKFSVSATAGSKIHSQSLWAYPVSGVLDELISLTPSTSSLISASDKLELSNQPPNSKLIYKYNT